MKRMKRVSKRINKLESHNIKTSTGHSIRLIFDKETKQVEVILDHELLQVCNQGVKSEDYIETQVQPYILVEGFGEPS